MNIWLRLKAFEDDHNAGCALRESLYEILVGYAVMGYTKTDVAAIIGISKPRFYLALDQIDIEGHIPWPDARAYSRNRQAVAS